MKHIVVTGATSMIGAALIEECMKHDTEVYAVVRVSSGKQSRLPSGPKLHLVDCDLENLDRLSEKIPEKCDTFYHIAWGNTGEARNKSTELQSRNIFYTLQAVRAAAELGCRRFIGAGSQAEYGPMDVEKISPDSPVNPSTPYGASKLAAGHLAGMLCRELGMECIWPRIFSVYGKYEKETTMVASGLRKMLAGEPTEFTPAMQRWDYLYSRDAGRAFYLIGEKGKGGSVYCVGSGQCAEEERRMQRTYEYEAVIHEIPENSGAYVHFPWDIRQICHRGHRKVDATFDDIPYRGNIVNMGVKDDNGDICYIIGIPKSIRSAIAKDIGDTVHVTIQKKEKL